MKMIDPFLESSIEEVKKICKKYEVGRLYLFGSSVNGNFYPGISDVDVFVHIPAKKIKNLVRFKIELAEVFNCRIDLFYEGWVSHPEIKEYIENNKVLIFEK